MEGIFGDLEEQKSKLWERGKAEIFENKVLGLLRKVDNISKCQLVIIM